jgi:hypothetical protein
MKKIRLKNLKAFSLKNLAKTAVLAFGSGTVDTGE